MHARHTVVVWSKIILDIYYIVGKIKDGRNLAKVKQ